MNKDEYIIINKTTLEKRIKELRKWAEETYYSEGEDGYYFAKEELEDILAQSTPLIPENINKILENNGNVERHS